MWNEVLTAGLTGLLVSFLVNQWLGVRLKAAIEHEYQLKLSQLEHSYNQRLESHKEEVRGAARVRDARWDIKREACLGALAVVDAVYSNLEWKTAGKAFPAAARQQVDVARAREAMNRLALACDGTEVVESFSAALGLRGPEEPPVSFTADRVNDLRNAARRELGFGKDLPLNSSKAWIASLPGAAPAVAVPDTDPSRPA